MSTMPTRQAPARTTPDRSRYRLAYVEITVRLGTESAFTCVEVDPAQLQRDPAATIRQAIDPAARKCAATWPQPQQQQSNA